MKKVLLSLMVVSSLVACHKSETVQPKGKPVNVPLRIAETKTKSLAGEYKRYTAPEFLGGVKVAIQYLEKASTAQEQTFLFHPGGDDAIGAKDIVLKDVKVGQNKFTATGINQTNGWRHLFSVERPDLKDKKARANKYISNLSAQYPIYANYTGELEQFINEGENPITIHMNTKSHRAVFVVENPAKSGYNIRVKIKNKSGYINTDPSLVDLIKEDNQVAFIINDNSTINSETYTVEVRYYTLKTDECLNQNEPLTSTLSVVAKDEKGMLAVFNKEGLDETEVKALFVWPEIETTVNYDDLY